MEVWDRLRAALAGLPPESVASPAGGRIGAALVLLREVGDDLEIVYTRRRDDLRSHPGQISFPGGRVDPGETIEEAAVREAVEEVGLDAATITLLGRLPALYIPPSRFWLQAVLARWDAPHRLVAAEDEVAEVLAVRLSLLRDPDTWRAVRLSTTGWSWAWDLGASHLLWGATGFLTGLMLDLLDAGWSGGLGPGGLPPDRHVTPWNRPGYGVPVGGPALLEGIPEHPHDAVPARLAAAPDAAGSARAGAALADAVARLRRAPAAPGEARRRVTVLAGPGWTGTVGVEAARILGAQGYPVTLVLAAGDPPGTPAAGAGVTVARFNGHLPEADIVIDALVGRGLNGSLRGRPLELAHLLRTSLPTVIAVDLPSGVDPGEGLIGELLPADVTIALAAPQPGLFTPGLGPFVGDLYVAPLTGPPPLFRLTPGPDTTRWRE